MLMISCLISFAGMPRQHSFKASQNLSHSSAAALQLLYCGYRRYMRLLRACQRCSIGLRSGE